MDTPTPDEVRRLVDPRSDAYRLGVRAGRCLAWVAFVAVVGVSALAAAALLAVGTHLVIGVWSWAV